jgi:hypothetical protein
MHGIITENDAGGKGDDEPKTEPESSGAEGGRRASARARRSSHSTKPHHKGRRGSSTGHKPGHKSPAKKSTELETAIPTPAELKKQASELDVQERIEGYDNQAYSNTVNGRHYLRCPNVTALATETERQQLTSGVYQHFLVMLRERPPGLLLSVMGTSSKHVRLVPRECPPRRAMRARGRCKRVGDASAEGERGARASERAVALPSA